MKTKLIIIGLLLFVVNITEAQHILRGNELLDSLRVLEAQIIAAQIDGADTSLYVPVRRIVVIPPMIFKTAKKRRQYNRLAYNIKKVYPYAVEIRNTYAEVEQDIVVFETKKEQRKFVKMKEKELRDKFEKDLINLTFYQGRLLIKLVDRETGSTTYEVIKEFKGGMNAFFWQSFAIMFGANLKSQFNSEEDDMIEDIIIRIENGEL